MEEGITTQSRGRRRRIIIVLAACVLVAIGVVAFWPGEREPEYNGKKLSEWCFISWPWTGEGSVGQEQAWVAIDHIGTNALPFLVKWLRCDRRSSKERMADLFVELKERLHRNSGARNSLRPFVRAEFAVFGFEALGTNASPAIPALAKLIRDRTSSSMTIRTSAEALAFTGEHGVRTLGELLRDPTQPHRSYIAAGLVYSGQYDAVTAQVLIEFAQDFDTEVAVQCAKTLGQFRPIPKNAVSSFKKGVGDSRSRVRLVAIDSLAKFGNAASLAVPELIQALHDSDASVRQLATNALREIAPEVLTNGVKDF